jgi:hypothetical protein
MIIEVPDLKKYDKFFQPLVFHEHTNHFSIEILERICRNVGFELITYDTANCSREFGFAALFQKIEKLKRKRFLNRYYENLYYFSEAKNRSRSYNKFILDIYENIRKAAEGGEYVILWGANDIMRSIIESGPLLKNVIYLDSDSKKKNFLIDFGIKVSNPFLDEIDLSKYTKFVLCASPNFLKQILGDLRKLKNITFEEQDVWIASELY